MISWKHTSAALLMAAVPALVGLADDPASDRPLWSFRPVVTTGLPAVRRTGWPLAPIDFYVLAKLEERGIEPAPPADKRTLIRRATFDLIGLPPTPAEIREFLADEAPDAFARLVDRLLHSPHYGERWGRHWLDVARYADSNGMDENLVYANAFRYRDYVVAAFNQDMPYRDFISEQLAGDLLPPEPSRSDQTGRVIATGFLTLGPKMLAEDDPVKMEMDIIDEQVDTIGRTFMGLTLGCARCHDHKFDPVSMADYYAMAGILKSTRTMDNFKVVARWHERAVGSAEAIAQQEASLRAISERREQIAQQTARANEAVQRLARSRIADYLIAARDAARYGSIDLKPIAGAATPPGQMLVEAESFARGNVKKEFAGYGAEIGVVYNAGELPNFAEYELELTSPGRYQLDLRYAAADSRPVLILVNGNVAKMDGARHATGSWFPDTQTWFAEAVLELPAGKNMIRLERAEPFPHIDKLALSPVERGDWKSAEQLASERNLNVEFLRQWVRYLDQTRSDASSIFAAWHELTAEKEAADPLFSQLQAAAVQAVANHYQELFQKAEDAWQALKANPDSMATKELPDSNQEAFRKVLYEPTGPFALPKQPESLYPAETAAELTRLREQLTAIENAFKPLPDAMAVRDGKPQDLRIHQRGSHLSLGELVPRRFPVAIDPSPAPMNDEQSGRVQLAEWLASADHPLTSRVMVNRIWSWHFGEGLVRSTDNFGQLGDRPVHAELLDWLAIRLVDSGWSLKKMHRELMLSATYQMSTEFAARSAEVDPENRLHWRMNRRRLEAESIRDAMLAASGQLDRTMGGSLLDGNNRSYVKGYPNSNYNQYDFNRRSIYLPVLRSMLYEVFQAFDFPDPSMASGERSSTTVAPQALFALNSKLIGDQSKAMAERLILDSSLDDAGRIRLAYESALGRDPNESELSRAIEFVQRYELELFEDEPVGDSRRVRAWQGLCRAIMASSEFIYVD